MHRRDDEDRFPDLPGGSTIPFRPSDVPPLDAGDLAHIAGTDGTGMGGHLADSDIPGATRFPGTVAVDDLEGVLRSVLNGKPETRNGKWGRFELRARIVHADRIMIVQVVLESTGGVASVYPVSGDFVTFLLDSGQILGVPLNLDDLVAWKI